MQTQGHVKMEFALHDSIQELYSNRIIPDSKLSIKYNSILVDDNNRW
jgi:hypothetical protein